MKKDRKKIKARQILTNVFSPDHSTNEDFFVLPTGELRSMSESVPLNRLKILALIGIILILTITLRGSYLEASRSIFQKKVENNVLRLRVEYAPRGVIFDRNGKQLVQNIASTDLVIYPAQLPKDVEAEMNILREIFKDVPVSAFQEIISKVNRNSTLPIPLLSNINHEQMLAVQARSSELPGINIENIATREYEDAEIFSHVLGYMGRITETELKNKNGYLPTESLGKSGIEYSYEKSLRGVHGAKREEVDSAGHVVNDLGTIDSQPGFNLKLNIDAELQKRLHEDLSAQLKKVGVKKGAAVAIDPETGGILAMVSIPSFNNTKLTQGLTGKEASDLFNDQDYPLLNRVIQGEYPPGSTFKLAVAIAGLKEEIVNTETTVNSTGGIRVGSWFFPDWKPGGHGVTNIYKAIAESVNTYFYMIGGGIDDKDGLGIERVIKWAKKLGFGTPVGIDIPGENDGFLPTPEWKKKTKNEPWYIGDTYHASIGQGDVLVTPLQIAQITALIANGGTFYEPHVVQNILKNDGGIYQEIKPKPKNEYSLDKKTAEIMRMAMRETVLSGSGRLLGDLSVTSAGKTGTAQSMSGLENTHAWFTSFAPYEKPQIALTVLIEKGGGGDLVAVPIAKDIYNWYFGGRNKQNLITEPIVNREVTKSDIFNGASITPKPVVSSSVLNSQKDAQ